MKEKWIADFSKPEKSCFDIKPEISYNAYLEKNTLFLGLKKKNCMAWLETVNRVYVDQVIEARFRFDNHGGYCAAGIMFRITGQGYYIALVSSKGYFRLDAVNNNIPKTLIGWTETPFPESGAALNESAVNLGIIASGGNLVFLLNDKWIAEANDPSIPGGHLGFVLVSYNENSGFSAETQPSMVGEGYVCRSWLKYLSVDARTGAAEAEYGKWNESVNVNAESRFRLAESFAALDNFDAAYNQMLKAWRQREEAARSVTATYTDTRAKEELLFAARMATRLGRYAEADEYVEACLALDATGDEPILVAERAKIMCAQNKYEDLALLLQQHIKQAETAPEYADIPSLYALLGHACWNLKDYNAAAAAWNKAFGLDGNNGLYAANAANAYEQMGKNSKALQYNINAAQCFLRQEDYMELGALVPKLLALGKNSREANALAEKWASATGNENQAQIKSALEDGLRDKQTAAKPKTASPERETKAKQNAAAAQKTTARAAVKPKVNASPALTEAKAEAKPRAGKTAKIVT